MSAASFPVPVRRLEDVFLRPEIPFLGPVVLGTTASDGVGDLNHLERAYLTLLRPGLPPASLGCTVRVLGGVSERALSGFKARFEEATGGRSVTQCPAFMRTLPPSPEHTCVDVSTPCFGSYTASSLKSFPALYELGSFLNPQKTMGLGGVTRGVWTTDIVRWSEAEKSAHIRAHVMPGSGLKEEPRVVVCYFRNSPFMHHMVLSQCFSCSSDVYVKIKPQHAVFYASLRDAFVEKYKKSRCAKYLFGGRRKRPCGVSDRRCFWR